MEIKELLKSKGLSVTDNRIKIIDCLMPSHGEHFHSISDISLHLGDINTKSIYNNIKQLIDVGIVDSYSFGGVSKYALNENATHGVNEIHLVHGEKEIHHLEVSKEIFKMIDKEIKKSGHQTTSIKIFVKVK